MADMSYGLATLVVNQGTRLPQRRGVRPDALGRGTMLREGRSS
jgi:hypothetical protein